MQEFVRNTPGDPIPIDMVLSSDHATPAPGKALTVTIRKVGGDFEAPLGPVSESSGGGGAYAFRPEAADLSEAGPLLVHVEAPGCDPYDKLVLVRPDPGTPVYRRDSTDYPFPMLLVASVDHVTGLEGANAVFERWFSEIARITCSGAVAEVGLGWYELHPDPADVADQDVLKLRASAPGADPATDEFPLGFADSVASAAEGSPGRPSTIWQGILAALEATGVFASVRMDENPADKFSELPATTPDAVLTPGRGHFDHLWSDGGEQHHDYLLTVTVSDYDPPTRFFNLDWLGAACMNALNRRSIAGLNVPEHSWLQRHEFVPRPPLPLKMLQFRGDAPTLIDPDVPIDASEPGSPSDGFDPDGFGGGGDEGFGVDPFGAGPFGGLPDPDAPEPPIGEEPELGEAGFGEAGFGVTPFGV